MSNYRRAYLPGGIYFFTVVTFNRIPVFTDENRVEVLRQAFRKVKATRPFEIDAMVMLPEQLHCIWRIPEGDADFFPLARGQEGAFRARLAPLPMRATSAWCGSADSESMPFAMRRTGAGTWITFITIR